MVTLASIRRTTWAGISQFQGVTVDGCPVYVRYKWGELSAWLGTNESTNALEGQQIFWREYGHRHNFDITWNEVETQTGIRCVGMVEEKYQ